MAINLKKLSPSELQRLIKDAEVRIQAAQASRLHEVRQKIDVILKGAGLSLDEVYPARSGKGTKTSRGKSPLKGQTVAPKYRNPEDPSQTWTGRGRQPSWVVAALKKRGASLDNLLIGSGKTKATTKKAPQKAVKKVAKKAVRKRTARA